MRHIELMGLPGAGKTTIGSMFRARAGGCCPVCFSIQQGLLKYMKMVGQDGLLKLLLRVLPSRVAARRIVALYRMSKDSWRNQCCFVATHGAALRAVIDGKQFHLMSIRERSRSISRFLDTACAYQALVELKDDTIVFDEGFIQCGVSCFLAPNRGEVFDAGSMVMYLEAMPEADLVIDVDTPLSVCVDRLEHRGRTLRLAGSSEEDLIVFLRNSEKYLNEVRRILDHRGVRVIRVDNAGHADSTAAAIHSIIEDYL